MATKTATSNDDLMNVMQDMMQMTSDGFALLEGRIGKVEWELGNLSRRMGSLERQYTALQEVVAKIESEQKGQHNDIKEVLNRLLALEKQPSPANEATIREMQLQLQTLIDWALKVAREQHIPLKLTR